LRFGSPIAREFWSTVGAVAIAAATLSGQEPPKISGEWKLGGHDPAITGRGNATDGQLSVGTVIRALSISQNAKSITIEEQDAMWGANTIVYHLDGTAVTNTFRMLLGKTGFLSGNRPVDVVEKVPGAEYTSKWKGSQLISAITVEVPGEREARRYEETIALDADGVLSIRIRRVGTGDSRTLYYKKQ